MASDKTGAWKRVKDWAKKMTNEAPAWVIWRILAIVAILATDFLLLCLYYLVEKFGYGASEIQAFLGLAWGVGIAQIINLALFAMLERGPFRSFVRGTWFTVQGLAVFGVSFLFLDHLQESAEIFHGASKLLFGLSIIVLLQIVYWWGALRLLRAPRNLIEDGCSSSQNSTNFTV